MNAALTIFLVLNSAFIFDAFADSATWNLNPTSGDWNTAANWTPATVPNGSADTATFDLSNNTSVSVSSSVEVNGIIFDAPSPFTITTNDSPGSLTISGFGIINESGLTQNFVTTAAPLDGLITFTGSASAGGDVVFRNEGRGTFIGGGVFFEDTSTAATATFINEGAGGDLDHQQPGAVLFHDSASADHATFFCKGAFKGGFGGGVAFFGSSTAANGTFTCDGAVDRRASGGSVQFSDTATAGDGVFTLNGTDFEGSGGAFATFLASSTAGNATLIANGGAVAGGSISLGGAGGGTPRIEVFGNGSFFAGPVTIGSLEGDGLVFLGSNNLTIGSNNLSTTFSGVIQDTGSVTKIGKGRLTLSSANTYTGGTTISRGTLRVTNTTGSATGSGSIQVTGGILGGTGIVAGETSLFGTTGVAILEPSAGGKKPATLTIQSALHFKGSVYNYQLDTRKARGDLVVANGVSIENQDQFTFLALRNDPLTVGQIFVVISNTAATPISGRFGNLADGAKFRAGRNTFQANYEGGDGNDLTLTVVP